jgi:TolB-like protein
MRSSVLTFGAILLSATVPALAQTAPGNGPTTYPTVLPSVVAGAPNNAPVVVMVLPFKQISNATDGSWISAAIAEDLRLSLMENPAVRVVSPPANLPDTLDQSLQAGRAAGANLVVYGTYQIANGQLRVTGTMVNSADGSVVAPLRATGDLHDLFHMEDALAMQLQRVLPPPPGATAQANAAPPQVTNNYYYPAQQPQESPDEDYYPPAPDYGYAGDPYDYDYGFGVPYFGFGYVGGYYGGFHGGRTFNYGRGFRAPSRGFGGSHFGGVGGIRGGFGGGGFHGGGGGGRR